MWEVYFLIHQKPLIKSGLLFKLQAYGVEGQILALLKDYQTKSSIKLSNVWLEKKNSRVPQGSVLELLLFLIFIIDLSDGITSICKIFADDTSLFSKVYDIDISAKN